MIQIHTTTKHIPFIVTKRRFSKLQQLSVRLQSIVETNDSTGTEAAVDKSSSIRGFYAMFKNEVVDITGYTLKLEQLLVIVKVYAPFVYLYNFVHNSTTFRSIVETKR